MPQRDTLLIALLLAVCSFGCTARRVAAPPAPPPTGMARLEKADVSRTGEEAGEHDKCWHYRFLVCDIDGKDPGDREFTSGRDLRPGHHRIRVECGEECEVTPGASKGTSTTVGFLAAGIGGAIAASREQDNYARHPAITLELDAEPGRTYYIVPIPDSAPQAPWVEIVEASQMTAPKEEDEEEVGAK